MKYPPKAMPCCVTARVVALSSAALQASWRALALRQALARAGRTENASGHRHCRLQRPGRERMVGACIPAFATQKQPRPSQMPETAAWDGLVLFPTY